MDERKKIMVIDDEESILLLLKNALTKQGYEVFPYNRPLEALKAVQEIRPDLVITDLMMPDIGGLEVINNLRGFNPEINVILITAHASLETAISALREGASDYLVKPFSLEELGDVIRRSFSWKRILFSRDKAARDKLQDYETQIIGGCRQLNEIREVIRRVAPTEATVLITGESGTGKELVARLTHRQSKRRDAPFVSINCAALPEPLLESELFGYEKGAFTGANKNKSGLLEIASGGTFFFDEIGEIPLTIQAKLLRVIQERKVRHVGGLRDISIDVRIVAATSRDLREEAAKGRFREDLFYRLNVVSVKMPPLRDREEDIPRLIEFFNRAAAKRIGREPVVFDDAAKIFLNTEYDWPGNVREMENLIERISMLADNTPVTQEKLFTWMEYEAQVNLLASGEERKQPGEGLDLKTETEEFEKQLILKALEQSAGNKFQAAKILNISRQSLQYKLKKYGLE